MSVLIVFVQNELDNPLLRARLFNFVLFPCIPSFIEKLRYFTMLARVWRRNGPTDQPTDEQTHLSTCENASEIFLRHQSCVTSMAWLTLELTRCAGEGVNVSADRPRQRGILDDKWLSAKTRDENGYYGFEIFVAWCAPPISVFSHAWPKLKIAVSRKRGMVYPSRECARASAVWPFACVFVC